MSAEASRARRSTRRSRRSSGGCPRRAAGCTSAAEPQRIQMDSMWAGNIARASRGRCSASVPPIAEPVDSHPTPRTSPRGPRVRRSAPSRPSTTSTCRRARLADVPDRPQRRREVDAARLHLRPPPRRRGAGRRRGARGDALDGASPNVRRSRTVFQTTPPLAHLDVLGNAMVGCHPWTRAGFVEAMLRVPWQRGEERRIEEDAHGALGARGPRRPRGRPAGSLPLGQLRLLAVARRSRSARASCCSTSPRRAAQR